MTARSYRLLSPQLTAMMVALVLAVLLCFNPTNAWSAPPMPPGLPAAVDPASSYTPQTSCEPFTKPGTARLAKLLTDAYAGTSAGTARACGSVPNSEHYDGRSIDWMVSVRDTSERRQATAMLKWLRATDARGNKYANARRLGVMYLIWNNKIWGIYNADQDWRDYSSCADHPEKSWDSTCHRNHVHISLSWPGAQARTSFWSKKIADLDYGPCRPADLNWVASYAGINPNRCTRYPAVRAPQGASANLKVLTTYSGMILRRKSEGPAVKAVQKVVRVSATGYFGAATRAGVLRWQRAHGLTATGGINHKTWRAILKDQAP